MQTIKLKISDKVYDKLIWLLSKFSKDEVEIVKEDESYNATNIYLEKELDEMNNGKASFHAIEELDNILESAIGKMMKLKFKKTFTQRLSRQVEYISKDSHQYARKFKNDLLDEIRQIPQNPHIYRKSIYFDDNNIRDLIFKGYCIVFRINKDNDSIEVFGFVKYQENPTD